MWGIMKHMMTTGKKIWFVKNYWNRVVQSSCTAGHHHRRWQAFWSSSTEVTRTEALDLKKWRIVFNLSENQNLESFMQATNPEGFTVWILIQGRKKIFTWTISLQRKFLYPRKRTTLCRNIPKVQDCSIWHWTSDALYGLCCIFGLGDTTRRREGPIRTCHNCGSGCKFGLRFFELSKQVMTLGRL